VGQRGLEQVQDASLSRHERPSRAWRHRQPVGIERACETAQPADCGRCVGGPGDLERDGRLAGLLVETRVLLARPRLGGGQRDRARDALPRVGDASERDAQLGLARPHRLGFVRARPQPVQDAARGIRVAELREGGGRRHRGGVDPRPLGGEDGAVRIGGLVRAAHVLERLRELEAVAGMAAVCHSPGERGRRPVGRPAGAQRAAPDVVDERPVLAPPAAARAAQLADECAHEQPERAVTPAPSRDQ
jgi:hypothetical protein